MYTYNWYASGLSNSGSTAGYISGTPTASNVNLNLTMSDFSGCSVGVSKSVSVTAQAQAIVQSLSPNVWQAGTTFTLTISGTGFTSAPNVSISGAPGASTAGTASTNAAGTQIQVPVIVQANAPNSTATVTVQPSSNGQGFVCGTACNGNGSGSNTAAVLAAVARSPTIILGTDPSQCGQATDQSGKILKPSVGQQVAFIACIPQLPNGLTLQSESWSPAAPDTNATIGSFKVVDEDPTHTGTVTMAATTNCMLGNACAFSPFYFVKVGAQATFQFTYTLSNGSSGISSIYYSPVGPQGVTINLPSSNNVVQQYTLQGRDRMGLGQTQVSSNSLDGIAFQASAAADANVPGTYVRVQLVTYADTKVIDEYGIVDVPTVPGLDNSYPYTGHFGSANVMEVGDAPFINLSPTKGLEQTLFKATMYLMWKPVADQACLNGEACILPIPLVSVDWGYTGLTINSLNGMTNGASEYDGWLLQPCSNPTKPIVHILSDVKGYPQWTQLVD